MERKAPSKLPPSMAERAVTARRLAVHDPSLIDTDDDMLPWVFDSESELWLSFDGNYSKQSPAEKRAWQAYSKQREQERQEELVERAWEEYDKVLYWSKIRQEVLDRDRHTCHLCGHTAMSKLHVHHILKRVKGGTDHLDNLITVCSRCHKKADSALYDPDWSKSPCDTQ